MGKVQLVIFSFYILLLKLNEVLASNADLIDNIFRLNYDEVFDLKTQKTMS